MKQTSALDLPVDLKARIEYGLYGGHIQYFINGVDGTLAQLGDNLPPVERLRHLVTHADKAHSKLIRRLN